MSRSERSATTGIAFSARSTGIHATNPLRTDKFDLRGVSWFGAEGGGACPDGLWQRPASEYLDFVKQNGFNAIRLPLAADTILADPEVGKWSLTANTDWRGLSSLALLERIVKLAAKRGLLILLDLHRLHANVWPTAHGVWHDEEMPANKLEEAWRIVAKRFCRYWNIFAADLFNEPWGATWGDGDEERDWPLYASRLGDIVLQECPRWLVFVEGVGAGPKGSSYDCEPSTDWSGCFWGENLRGLDRSGVRLSTPDRLVYSPHLYGPGTKGGMWYFNSTHFPEYPSNLPAVWRQHWLNPAMAAGATLVIGEWGGKYTDLHPNRADEQWQLALKSILIAHGISSFYWALNPNSGDTGGLLGDDWTTPKAAKLQMLAGLPSSNALYALASTPAFACPSDFSESDSDYLFRCVQPDEEGNAMCVQAVQACNGVFECPDRSDERKAACKAADVKSQPCMTVGGQDALRPCVLPFVYRGVKYDACALDDAVDGKAWCPTSVVRDERGLGHYHSYASWGVCGPGCDREPGRKLQDDGCAQQPEEQVYAPPQFASIDAMPGRRLEKKGSEEQQQDPGWRPLPPLPVHCAPPPSPPPSPPSPPPSLPPPSAPPPWTLADASPLVLLLGGVMMLLVAVVAVVALRRLTRVEKAPSAGGKKRRKGKGRRAVEEEDEWTEEDGLASRGRGYSYDSE